MEARFRSWWQKIRQHRVAIAIITAIIVVVIALIIIGYWFDVTGFNGYTQVSTIRTLSGPTAGTVTRTEVYQSGKTLWDWMQLLIVPVALAIVAILFNRATTRSEQKIAQLRYQDEQNITEQRYQNDLKITLDKQREDLLQAYLDRMSELLLDNHLTSSPNEQVRKLARVRTTTTLFQLDARRIGYVFSFLREAGLMSRQSDKSIISLSEANLSNINFSQANLMEANLSGADLSGANLSGTLLLYANLSEAKLLEADLSGAILGGADLSNAFLWDANLSGANLSGIGPDGDALTCNLTGAQLYGANLNGAYLYKVDLTRTNGADLSGAHLTEPTY